jgi:tetratricopeptide (TPR) repeat protein
MRLLMAGLLACALLGACSEERPDRPAGQTLIQTDPLAEVKAELARDPRNAEAWLHLADLYERSGNYGEEADALMKVLDIDPTRGFASMKLGTAYNRLGRYTDAVSRFQQAKRHLAKNPVLYNNLAYSYGKLNKTGEQIASLKKAIALRPGYATARYNLGMAYLKQQKREDALKQYDALRNIDAATAASLKKEIDASR